jgi:alpha-tubulin suppressor-like RCC1 family protein
MPSVLRPRSVVLVGAVMSASFSALVVLQGCVGDDPAATGSSADGATDSAMDSAMDTAASDAEVDGGPALPCDGGCASNQACFEGVCGGAEILSVHAGFNGACVLRKSGGVWCWGNDDLGFLGSSTDDVACGVSTCRPSPEPVAGLPPLVELTVGAGHLCGIDKAGAVWCWGANVQGRLGHDPVVDPACAGGQKCSRTPTKVAGLTDVLHVSAGATQTCAVTKGGAVYCWGSNAYCQSGGVPSPDDFTPRAVAGTAPGIKSIFAGTFTGDVHQLSCAIDSTDVPSCWGDNTNLELGHSGGATSFDGGVCGTTPTPVIGQSGGGATLTGIRSVSFGESSACGLTNAGAVYCWGVNAFAAFGIIDNVTPPTATPKKVPITTQLTSVSGQYTHRCGVAGDAAVWCWGTNNFGELGRGTGGGLPGDPGSACSTNQVCGLPLAVPSLAAKAVAAGAGFTVALLTDGTVVAWGTNDYAELGHMPKMGGDLTCTIGGGMTPCGPTPVRVMGLP